MTQIWVAYELRDEGRDIAVNVQAEKFVVIRPEELRRPERPEPQ